MQKKIFLVDFDNTSVDTRRAHSLYVNDTYKIQSVPEDFVNNASLSQVIKKYNAESTVTEEEAVAHLGEYFHTSHEWHKEVKPIDEYIAIVLPELSKKYDFTLGTARSDFSEDVVRNLLELHFPKCVGHIHFVHRRKGFGDYDRVRKREYVETIGPEKFACFVDDSTKEIQRMGNIIPSHLFDRWNLYTNIEVSSKMFNWKEIGDKYL